MQWGNQLTAHRQVLQLRGGNKKYYFLSKHQDSVIKSESRFYILKISCEGVGGGEGVGVGHHARLTDRFVRMDQARTKPGAGLGLSMVKAIASNHGGSLQLSSADPGFLATVTLPPAWGPPS